MLVQSSSCPALPGKALPSFLKFSNFLVFLFCIIISAFFWLILTLNRNYTSTIGYPILFKNLPNGKVILNTLPETVEIEISTNGFSMLFLKLSRRLPPLEINLLAFKNSNKQDYYHFILKHEIDKIFKTVLQENTNPKTSLDAELTPLKTVPVLLLK